jgi:hypothetical protein
MTKYQRDATYFTNSIKDNIHQLYCLLHEALSRPDKSFDIQIGERNFKLYPSTSEQEEKEQYMERETLIQFLIRAAIIDYMDSLIDTNESDPWKNIIGLISGEDPADHQFEIIKEEVVTNLDADGNPITAKPLNDENVLVQWQDQNRFKFEENA